MPSAAVLHYAQEIFEGMKAYRHEDGSIWTFRPEANAQRMIRSARRMTLPELPEEDFIASLRALVEVDQAWVPAPGEGEASLYLRPFMYASEAFLGRASRRRGDLLGHRLAGRRLLPGGIKPVTLWLSTDYARAGEGGTGAAKCGGNYASSLAGQLEGIENGCDQAVFLDASTHTYVEELGGMNLFFVTKDNKLVTPELTGSILEGVTRSSVLELAKEMGLEPEERRVPIQEWKDGAASGEIVEIFACGTAAVITPVGELRWEGGSCDHRSGVDYGEVTRTIRERLLDIQYGRDRGHPRLADPPRLSGTHSYAARSGSGRHDLLVCVRTIDRPVLLGEAFAHLRCRGLGVCCVRCAITVRRRAPARRARLQAGAQPLLVRLLQLRDLVLDHLDPGGVLHDLRPGLQQRWPDRDLVGLADRLAVHPAHRLHHVRARVGLPDVGWHLLVGQQDGRRRGRASSPAGSTSSASSPSPPRSPTAARPSST